MNYIGFYLCYLLQTAKLINVLSSVLTQLFGKVKEVQRNFPPFSGEGEAASPTETRPTATTLMKRQRRGLCGPLASGRETCWLWISGPQWAPDNGRYVHALHLLGVATKVWTCHPPLSTHHPPVPLLLLLRFIPADCSFSNANGVGQGLGFLPVSWPLGLWDESNGL